MQLNTRHFIGSRFIAIYVAALCLLAVGSATANPSAIARPAEISQTIDDARSVGATRLRVFGFQIYDARLWAQPNFEAQAYTNSPFALEINYLRKFDNNAVAERSIQEMRKLGSMTEAQAAQWLAKMRKIFPDIVKGDRLVGIHNPGVGAVFTFNGKPVGEIKDPDFARLFFGIWLSPQSSEPQMRRELLGMGDTKP
jgi:Chalcone isomerase-like